MPKKRSAVVTAKQVENALTFVSRVAMLVIEREDNLIDDYSFFRAIRDLIPSSEDVPYLVPEKRDD